jgi:abortive infection bacteriophage resistance protein
MVQYTKPWLSLEQQVERPASRGVDVGDRERAAALLKAIGYYRLTGYLYPFRESEQYVDDEGRNRTRVLDGYRPGTALHHAESIIDFDRRLRMLVMDGVERIEVAVRMQIGYVLGRVSAFAHEDPACFTAAFTAEGSGEPTPSSHMRWLRRADE